MVRGSHIPEERLASLYDSDGFGGEKTMRAKVIRELIDEIRLLRHELAQARGQATAGRPAPKPDGTAVETARAVEGPNARRIGGLECTVVVALLGERTGAR